MRSIAIQLIQKNVEPIEERLVRAVSLGQSSPIALIYDLACTLGQKVIAVLSALDGDLTASANAVIAEAPADSIPFNIAVMDRLTMGDLIADVLGGSVADTAMVNAIVALIASPCPTNTFPILSIARKDKATPVECEVVGLLHKIGDSMS